ncbi:WhiB family transcriptional regulator [Saccharopolyspora sp. NPDC000359]|uniref:WhiB family transcriptional regulator n=1 Tax=Saccharopolyspora sp. NPDC000359 TaxID=3154251 RepID=UPI003316DBF1
MQREQRDWRHEAVCREQDPELFFPVGDNGPAVLQTAAAKAVCQRCPVAAQCLEWALATGQDAGVWGGMSAAERRVLQRRTPLGVSHPRRARCAGPGPHLGEEQP